MVKPNPLSDHFEHSCDSENMDGVLFTALQTYRKNEEDLEALNELISRLMWIAYEVAQRFSFSHSGKWRKIPPEEAIGECVIGLYTAVRRLLVNGRSDIIGFVRDVLRRIRREYRRSEIFGTHVPHSTNATRRKKGQDEHKSVYLNQFPVNEDEESHESIQKINGTPYQTEHTAEIDLVDLIEHISDTSGDRQLLDLMTHDFSDREIASQCGITRHAVQKVKLLAKKRYLTQIDSFPAGRSADKVSGQGGPVAQPVHPRAKRAIRVVATT